MPRKQVGAIDEELLAEVDRRAEFLGQTRRVFIERTLRERVARADWKATAGAEFLHRASEQALSEAKEPGVPEQADPGSVPSSEGVRSAAPAEQPREPAGATEAVSAGAGRSDDGASVAEPLSRADAFRRAGSSQAKRDVVPVPKRGEKK